MHEGFWIDRWASSQIGFHQKDINPYLRQQWPGLGLQRGDRVLVPLCGKSHDLAWLVREGLRVMGVELARKAVEDFFTEQQLQPSVREVGGFSVYASGSIELWCGDIFALTHEQVSDCAGLYDRAALIALPPAMRERYVAHLTDLLPGGCKGLLITLDYEQEKMDGPPFSVDDAEVQRLFQPGWRAELLERNDVLGKNWRFDSYGLTRTDENVYRVEKRG
ncbi:thiopurine S-methyltransferase [Stutzerimonas urumqiensis]|uniref:thiopurine S-methyltransferase n=1 Tax=Stutzerimonas urumqiensis TaxID=638269 RepID=UPI003BAD7BAD